LNVIVCLSQLSACPREQISCGVSARSSERIVRTLRRADCPRTLATLATGLTARLMRAALPRALARGSLLPRVPAQPTSRCRSNGPWDCGLQLPQWHWCRACSGSLCCPTQSHGDRHRQPRRLRRQLPDVPEFLFLSWPTDYPLKGS
jgi:hypothetical protein